MKLEKIVPLTELLSSVAVIITLICLTIQTQQTNDALLATSRQTTLETDMVMIAALIASPEFIQGRTSLNQ
jgi:hypothetical protein